MDTLRAGIKAKYQQYHLADRDRFPDITYNTNRANYKPLHDSFNEEFFVVRGLVKSTTVHIPSPNTLALLFTEDGYVPSKKILETCQSYAAADVVTPMPESQSNEHRTEQAPTKKWLRLSVGGVILLSVLLLFSRSYWLPLKPMELVIIRPTALSRVSQELVIEGTVANAETVWLAVHPRKSLSYWIQPAIKVQDDNIWLGVIYIGSLSKENSGQSFEVRAFVNPIRKTTSGAIYSAWPEAELCSKIVEVVRE